MQVLNKRFYNTFCPSIVDRVQLYQLGNMSVGFVVFPKDKYVNILMPSFDDNSLCQWQQKKFEITPGFFTYNKFDTYHYDYVTDSEDDEEADVPSKPIKKTSLF